MLSYRLSVPSRTRLRAALALVAGLAGGFSPAWAVSWTTGANSGNWIFLNPTSAKVAIGTISNPAEKLTVLGGNVMVDNNRFYKTKTTGGSSSNLIGLDNTNMVSIFDGKLTVQQSGNVGVGFVSTIDKFFVDGKTTLNGQLNVRGPTAIEAPLNALNTFWALSTTTGNLEVNGAIGSGGNISVTGEVIAGGMISGADMYGTSGSFNSYVETANIWAHGNLYLAGSIIPISRFQAMVEPHPTDDGKQIVHAAVEAGEVLTHVRGNARTSNGSLRIVLPQDFSLVTSAERPVTVLLTAENVPALLYVSSKSEQAIEVKIKASDFAEFGDVDFAYQVEGVKAGLEDVPTIQNVGAPAFVPTVASPAWKKMQERQLAWVKKLEAARTAPIGKAIRKKVW